MADEQSAPAVVAAMKGHPGSGESTAARAIAAALRCPLLDKDDVRDCTLALEAVAASSVLSELSYAVLWRVAEKLVQSVHLDALARIPGALVVIVECHPSDKEEWRRRLEKRGAAVSNCGGSDGWHKPKTWVELERLVEGYQGCTDYEIGDVPRIVVDTTDPTVDAGDDCCKVVCFGVKNYRRGISSGNRGLSLQSYDVDSATAVIQDGGVSLKVDTQNLRDISFRTNSAYQFIGELLIHADNEAILQARIGRNVDGLDLNLYQQALLIRRQHETKLRNSRRA
ncbi:uncharacterized protein C2845_PM11G16770 [Panicum miliaceum]|uniref:Uncharacterized protein n=1 Tax=Panicum miliaceum TaxID=4540 RepID=A0A3L6RTY7_PANMI|nr:uncharacterized protein C2845_PM11G16770 [Panicum miliaceum]